MLSVAIVCIVMGPQQDVSDIQSPPSNSLPPLGDYAEKNCGPTETLRQR